VRSRLLGLLLLVAACIPDEGGSWLIARPTNWGIIATVVQPGGYSSGIVVPEGRQRASALPLDTLELQWLALAPPGTTLGPPTWYALRNTSVSPPAPPDEPLDDCPALLPLSLAAPCRLGAGERLQIALGGTSTVNADFRGELGIVAVGSTDDAMTAEDCAARYLDPRTPSTDLRSCLFMERRLMLGPLIQLIDSVPEEVAKFIDVEIPPEAFDEEPDTHPVLESFLVTPGAGDPIMAGDGDTVHVRAGDRIRVTWTYAEGSEQDYFWLINDLEDLERYIVVMLKEVLIEDVALSRYVDEFDEKIDRRSWIAPDGPEPLLMHFYAADTREGRLAATLRFVSDLP
jgi:hypothetical protein